MFDLLRRLIPGMEPGWMYYNSYTNNWEKIETHHPYTVEERGEDYVIIDRYQVHEYFHSGKSETRLAGFKTGSHKIEDPESIEGEIGGEITMYVMGLAPQKHVPLDSFDREVTIT